MERYDVVAGSGAAPATIDRRFRHVLRVQRGGEDIAMTIHPDGLPTVQAFHAA